MKVIRIPVPLVDRYINGQWVDPLTIPEIVSFLNTIRNIPLQLPPDVMLTQLRMSTVPRLVDMQDETFDTSWGDFNRGRDDRRYAQFLSGENVIAEAYASARDQGRKFVEIYGLPAKLRLKNATRMRILFGRPGDYDDPDRLGDMWNDNFEADYSRATDLVICYDYVEVG